MIIHFLLCWALQWWLSLTSSPAHATQWRVYGGGPTANRYSELTQITPRNVHQLRQAWTYHTGDNDSLSTDWQCNPIMVDNTLYATSPKLKLLALDAATGKLRWSFDPFQIHPVTVHPSRGVAYWHQGSDQRILFSAGKYLYAINAQTGRLVPEFGNRGYIDLQQGLDRPSKDQFVRGTTPGIVYKNLYILSTEVSEGPNAAPGHIRAFDIRTGKRVWIFHTIPQPGEYGYDTWPKDAWKTVGGANAWSGISLDEQRGLIFLPIGSPSYDFYGSDRQGMNLFGNCVLALKAETGAYVWHFQTVHHDLWDRDLPSQPALVMVQHDGKRIDAVAQTTKSGYVYLLDRQTGKPLFPVEERPVPASDLPGEQAWPTQPFPSKPAPFSRQQFTEADITNLSPKAHDAVQQRLRQVRSAGQFVPPSKAGTVIFPGFDGGAEWGGSAIDPQKSILYVNANEMPWILTMVDVAGPATAGMSRGQQAYNRHCGSCHGPDRQGDQHHFPSLINLGDRMKPEAVDHLLQNGRGRMPSFQQVSQAERQALMAFLFDQQEDLSGEDSTPKEREVALPYTHTGYHRFLDPNGYPAVKPPWGTLNAIDLNEGRLLWQVPLGEYQELTKKGISPTGTENYGGPILTKSGLIFIGATKDAALRAFDQHTGRVLWKTTLPAGGYATPCTYAINGKQYVVIAAGGVKMRTKAGDALVAYSLPD